MRRGVLALINERGNVTGAASFRIGDPADFGRAVEFINDGRRGGRVVRYVDGETVRLSEPAPAPTGTYVQGDCERCDGWHHGDDCTVTNAGGAA